MGEIKFLIKATFEQAKSNGVTVLEIGADVDRCGGFVGTMVKNS